MLDQFQETQDSSAAWKTCFACLISPSPVGNLEQLVGLAELALKGKDSADFKSRLYEARSLAAYRAGDFEEAIKWCAESRKHDEGLDERRAHSLLIDAMALHQLKKTTEALVAFDQAIKHKDKAFPNESVVFKIYWRDWVVIELLRREAEALLQLPTASASKQQPNQSSAPDSTVTNDESLTTDAKK
jgi:tetratricopeptide (TPR) repeat protein